MSIPNGLAVAVEEELKKHQEIEKGRVWIRVRVRGCSVFVDCIGCCVAYLFLVLYCYCRCC